MKEVVGNTLVAMVTNDVTPSLQWLQYGLRDTEIF
jgi:hypothetical protein